MNCWSVGKLDIKKRNIKLPKYWNFFLAGIENYWFWHQSLSFFVCLLFFFFFFGWLVTIKGGLLSSTFYNRKCTNISVPLGKKTCCKLSNHGCSESFHKFITQTLYEGFLAFLGCVVVLVLAIFIISSLTLNS